MPNIETYFCDAQNKRSALAIWNPPHTRATLLSKQPRMAVCSADDSRVRRCNDAVDAQLRKAMGVWAYHERTDNQATSHRGDLGSQESSPATGVSLLCAVAWSTIRSWSSLYAAVRLYCVITAFLSDRRAGTLVFSMAKASAGVWRARKVTVILIRHWRFLLRYQIVLTDLTALFLTLSHFSGHSGSASMIAGRCDRGSMVIDARGRKYIIDCNEVTGRDIYTQCKRSERDVNALRTKWESSKSVLDALKVHWEQ